jgi:hypothetical protein
MPNYSFCRKMRLIMKGMKGLYSRHSFLSITICPRQGDPIGNGKNRPPGAGGRRDRAGGADGEVGKDRDRADFTLDGSPEDLVADAARVERDYFTHMF